MNYYYFVDYTIKVFEWEINTQLNPAYTELSDEQRIFYLDHPNASYWEVWNCQLDPVPEPPTLDEIKAEALGELSRLSLEILDKYVKAYQVANAQASLYVIENAPEMTPIYDAEKSINTLKTYDAVGLDLRNIYKTAETEILAASDASTVYALLNYYKHEYDEYEHTDE